MSYITLVFNHFRAIQQWAAETGGRVTLDAATFQLEVKHRNRYFSLHPQFIAREQGRLCNVPSITEGTYAFAGWRPYRPLTLPLAADKLAFKRLLVELGLRTPAWWPTAAQAEHDFVLKRSLGSFGMQIAGPFRVGRRDQALPGAAREGGGELFAEAFVEGRILKVWFWGSRPFVAHVQEFPAVEGDGALTLEALARRFFGLSEEEWSRAPAAAIVATSVEFQGLKLDAVPAPGDRVWIDFRYGHRDRRLAIPKSDNAIDALKAGVVEQLTAAGSAIGRHLRETVPAPVIVALDGMIDAAGHVWWLELNSNPALPPEGYREMFGDLFA